MDDARALGDLQRMALLPWSDRRRIDFWEVNFDSRRKDGKAFGVVLSGFRVGRGQTFAAAVDEAIKSRDL